MQKIYFILLFITSVSFHVTGQNNSILIDAKMDPVNRLIRIQQEIIFYNHSDSILKNIYLHNWANGYKNKKTPLAKRLIENYDKSLYFAKIKKRGYSKVSSVLADDKAVKWNELKPAVDIINIPLQSLLVPGDSVRIFLEYEVKIPSDKFTKYGYRDNDYDLRYWYITPAVFDGQWNLMSNLDMDDLFLTPTNYTINFEVPAGFGLFTDLNSEKTKINDQFNYRLTGKDRTDVEIAIRLLDKFNTYHADSIDVVTNLRSLPLNDQVKTDVLKRQLSFIDEILGSYPHKKIFVNDITYRKNPVYGLNQLPKKMAPFSKVFEWDIKMFKALTKEYIDNTLFVNRRTDYWLADGIQIYLMMEYVSKFYPEVKAIGNISKFWLIRNYSLAKLDFNGKYPFVYQFAARKNYDQSLVTRADSLSNFNRKIVNKYKAALGLRYLSSFLGDSIVSKSIKEFYRDHKLRLTESNEFNKIISAKSPMDLRDFFINYVHTKKKIDYTIKDIEKTRDSIKVNIVNKSNMTAPVALYGVTDRKILFKRWVYDIDSSKTVSIPRSGIERVSLNYEYLYPEVNLRNNWKKVDKKLLNRPLKFTFFKDIEDPYYNQIFYNIYFEYNYYDGVVLGPQLYNQAMFKKKWLFSVTPAYGFKSKSLIGGFSFRYQHLPENSIVYRYSAGISGGKSHYDKGLSYKKLKPFFLIEFKRKSLRDVGGSSLYLRYNIVDKEIPRGVPESESDRYNVFNVRYNYSQPNIIRDLRYFIDYQYNVDFSKIALDFRYRKLTDRNRQIDLRLFFGTFLFNKTTSDFFSFALDRPSDYMFDYGYMGRSEETGFFSQQIIISEGGFKSIFDNKYANQWLLSTNVSMSIWRWIEVYTDAGFVKNRDDSAFFRYDTGIRLNFVHNFLELYFPLQSSLGFEPSQPDYFSKIRFVVTIDPTRIYHLLRRGFY